MAVALAARVFDTQANQSFDATFERFPVRLGRNQLNDLPIDRPYVSQFHASFDVRDGRIFLRDLGSTNGTIYAGQRLQRDTPVDVTLQPEVAIGPIIIRLGLVQAEEKKAEAPKEGGVLDQGLVQAAQGVAPGAEDPYFRQVLPYIEAYRHAWQTVYRVIYDHLTRLPPEVRTSYLKRLSHEQAALALEEDFQKISRYYGVDTRMLAGAGPAQAALAAMSELSQTLTPGAGQLDDSAQVLAFARKLRDSTDVFLKCFVSLRDGYHEFEAEVLARERNSESGGVATAKDAKELADVLLGPAGPPEASRQLHDIFVDVMSHQVALLNGIMEGVKSLLVKLSPKTIEAEFERQGKKGGLFSNRFEALWKLYEVRHADYSGEDKETFLTIFGPQFSRAYTARAGEDYKGEARNLSRFTMGPGGGRQGPGGGPPR